MRVLFVTIRGPQAASSRYRVFNSLPYLDEAGIQCDVISPSEYRQSVPGPRFFGDAIFLADLMRRVSSYDVIYLQKVPLPPILVKGISGLASKIVFDFDDAIYTTPPWKEAEDSPNKDWIVGTIRNADCVVVGGDVLEDFARRFNDNVHVLSTALPREEYSEFGPGSEERELVLGWIGNPENLRYLEKREEAISDVLERYNDVNLHIVTSEERPITPFGDRIGKDISYKTWSQEKELDYLDSFDVALRPLTDDEWTRAKGGYTSVVQCMALGIPVVVSPVGMLTEIVEHGVSGFHATTDEEWVQYISVLLEDPDRRKKMGIGARKSIDKLGFWTDQYADRLVQLLRELGVDQ